jgi:WD40 repeat protein
LLAFSPNGRLLAATGAGKSGPASPGFGSGVDVWDTLTGEKAATFPVTPECIAFSPDGVHMATGGRDHCVLVWKAPKVQRRTSAKVPSPAERNAWWAALAGDAPAAYKVIGQLIDAPEHALALFKERVHPVPVGYSR